MAELDCRSARCPTCTNYGEEECVWCGDTTTQFVGDRGAHEDAPCRGCVGDGLVKKCPDTFNYCGGPWIRGEYSECEDCYTYRHQAKNEES